MVTGLRTHVRWGSTRTLVTPTPTTTSSATAVEVDRYQTDPLNSDTDRGGIKDGTEVYQGTNPLDPVDDNKPEFGMVLQDYSGPTVIESHTRTNLGSVYLQSGPNYGDCVMSPDGALGFATDSNGHIWIVGPAASPPERASGTNPIPLSVPGGDLAATSDGRFLVACGGYPSTAISVVDTASRAEIGTVELNALLQRVVDVCRDGSVLIATASPSRLRPLHHRCGRTPRRHRRRRRCPRTDDVSCSPDAESGVMMSALAGGGIIRSFEFLA